MNITEPCLLCGKTYDEKRDVDKVSEHAGIEAKYFHHCPRCRQLLTFAEAEAVRRKEVAVKGYIPANQ